MTSEANHHFNIFALIFEVGKLCGVISPTGTVYGLAEEIMAVTPVLLAALTGSLPAEVSVVRI